MQEGRAGRDGRQAAAVLLVDSSHRTSKALRAAFLQRSTVCYRDGLTKIFSLSNPDGEKELCEPIC